MITKYFLSGCLGENSYVITDEKSGLSAIIDPNFDSGAKDVCQKFNISLILLTHGHFDHILSCEEIKEITGAKIMIHKDDEQLLLEPSLNLSIMLGKNISIKADGLLEDGEVIMLGETPIKVISTAGHTNGSCCFIAENCMFSGDTLFCGSVGRTDFPTGSMDKMMKSVEKLKAIKEDLTVYCGHDDPTTLSKEKLSNPYFI